MRTINKMGTASMAPAIPHSQPQNNTDRNTDKGLSASRRPTTIGLMKLLSRPCRARKAAAGATTIKPRSGKPITPAISSITVIRNGPK